MDPACHLIVMCMLRDMVSDFIHLNTFFVCPQRVQSRAVEASRRLLIESIRTSMNNQVTVKPKKDSMNSSGSV